MKKGLLSKEGSCILSNVKKFLFTVTGILLFSFISVLVSSPVDGAEEAGQTAAVRSGEVSAPVPKRKKKVVPQRHREVQPGKIEVTGVIVMATEHGFAVISPTADESLGRGEKFLSENVSNEVRMGDEKTDKKPFGGIRLFGFLF